MERILVSACLLGQPVRYDGAAKTHDDELLARWRAEGRLLSFCPEVSGGLPIPRPPAEISAAGVGLGPTGATAKGVVVDADTVATRSVAVDGPAVLAGTARVLTAAGGDITEFFVRGATLALEVAERHGVRMAILKEGSPSCGSRRIYDGSFTGRPMPGTGVTTALLAQHGIRVFGEDQLPEAAAHLQTLEHP